MEYFIALVNSLKRGVISPVYLFYGDENYLREQAVSRFRQFFAGGSGVADLNFDLIDGEAVNPAEIVAGAETLPFFAEKRLVVVKNPTFLKSSGRAGKEDLKEEEEAKVPAKEALLLEYIKNPQPTTCLIFTTGEPVDKRKRIFKAIKKNGVALEFTYLGRGDLARWLAKKAGEVGKRFTTGAGEVLLDAVGPSLQSLVAELEKLFCYTAGQEEITPGDVRKVCPPKMEENIFAIVDAVGNRRCGEALAGIKEMLAAKEPPFKIFSMVTRQFRLLLQVHDLLGRGCPPREISSRLKMHPYVAQKIMAQCKNFSRPVLVGAFEYLSEVDVAVKTGRQDFYPALETFLLRLCAAKGKT